MTRILVWIIERIRQSVFRRYSFRPSFFSIMFFSAMRNTIKSTSLCFIPIKRYSKPNQIIIETEFIGYKISPMQTLTQLIKNSSIWQVLVVAIALKIYLKVSAISSDKFNYFSDLSSQTDILTMLTCLYFCSLIDTHVRTYKHNNHKARKWIIFWK
jgi:hypothetical protein